MKSLKQVALLVLASMSMYSCITLRLANGATYRNMFPAKDRIKVAKVDTTRFIKSSFEPSHYYNKTSTIQGKRIIEPVRGEDFKAFLNSGDKYYLYFCNPTCPATAIALRKLDSIAHTGEKIIIVSLRKDYKAIDRILREKSFGQYPYYTIEYPGYSNKLILRTIDFIKDMCSSCYERYRDEVVIPDYLILESGKVKFDNGRL